MNRESEEPGMNISAATASFGNGAIGDELSDGGMIGAPLARLPRPGAPAFPGAER
jgi:hypothetical protein